MPSSDLIGQIYEATAAPELWPRVLEDIADAIDAFGACFVHRSGESVAWVVSPRMEEFANAYAELGWVARDARIPPVIAEHHPGFRVDADYWTEEQQRETPIYRDFLLPRHMKASAASLIQGARNDSLHVGVEGLPSYAEARLAVPLLDSLRPHLARALSISTRVAQTYAQGVVNGLQSAGIGAAVIGPSGRVRAANDLFGNWFGGAISDLSGRVRLPDDAANRQLGEALSLGRNGRLGARSFPVRHGGLVAALHCLPLKGLSQDIFESDGFVVVIARPDNPAVPSADLLRLMFDLTPSEARVARLISQGRSVAEVARACDVQPNTVRIHLKAIYRKTGFAGQTDLAATLSSLAGTNSSAD